jgi:hypothetical protein
MDREQKVRFYDESNKPIRIYIAVTLPRRKYSNATGRAEQEI